jgi:lysophospholipase
MSKKKLGEMFNPVSRPAEDWREAYFTNRDGELIRYGHLAAPTPETSRGTIVLTHGYGEHIELYHQTIRYYQKKNFDVWMMEWSGHGKSRFYAHNPAKKIPSITRKPKSMASLANDLDDFVTKIVKRNKTKPVIMSTNSLGGHVGLLAMQRNPRLFDGAVMSTPMLNLNMMGAPEQLHTYIHTLFNVMANSVFGGEPLVSTAAIRNNAKARTIRAQNGRSLNKSRRHYEHEARKLYKDLQIPAPSAIWVSEAMKSIRETLSPARLQTVRTPILIGAAGNDSLVALPAMRLVRDNTKDTTLIELKNAHHSLWFDNDVNYRVWTVHVEKFLNRIAPENKYLTSINFKPFKQPPMKCMV